MYTLAPPATGSSIAPLGKHSAMGNRNCAKLAAVPLGAAAYPRRKHDFRPEFLPELTAVQNYCRLPGFTNVEPVSQAGLPCARATTSWPGPSPPCAGPQLLVRARAAPPRSAAGTVPRAPLWALRDPSFLRETCLRERSTRRPQKEMLPRVHPQEGPL